VFTTLRSTHYTPSSRWFHWNRVRAAAGKGNVPPYLATRHWFGWFALNVLELPPHVIAGRLGGRLVRELYGQPDAALAHRRARKAYRSITPVTTLPVAGGVTSRRVLAVEASFTKRDPTPRAGR
jgi:hypothetical protein